MHNNLAVQHSTYATCWLLARFNEPEVNIALVSHCVVSENIHTPPQKGLEIPGRRGGGVSKTQKFKAMYEGKLEFPEGWGGHRANPFLGGYGYFLEPHIISNFCFQ